MSIPAVKERDFLAPETRFLVPTHTNLEKVEIIDSEKHVKELQEEAFKAFNDCRLRSKASTSYETSTHDGRLYVNETELMMGKIEVLKTWRDMVGISNERRAAIENQLVPLELEKEIMDQEKEFADGFVNWMLGYGKPAEYDKCWWMSDEQKKNVNWVWSQIYGVLNVIQANGESESTSEQMNDYMKMLREKCETDKLAKGLPHLKASGSVLAHSDLKLKRQLIEDHLRRLLPKNAEECYLYYKYIVNNRSEGVPFLEAAELRPYFFWRPGPDPNVRDLTRELQKGIYSNVNYDDPRVAIRPGSGAQVDEYYDAQEEEDAVDDYIRDQQALDREASANRAEERRELLREREQDELAVRTAAKERDIQDLSKNLVTAVGTGLKAGFEGIATGLKEIFNDLRAPATVTERT
jgi:hypothetical protein